MSEKRKAVKRFNYDYISVIFLCGTAVVFLLDSTGIKDPDSRVFPLFVPSLAIALSVILVLKNLLHLGRAEEYDFTGTGRAMMMALSLFCYIVAIAAVGFYLSTPVYLYITMWLLGQRSQKPLILVSILAPVFVFVLFDVVFGMPIPQGYLFEKIL